MDKFKTLAAWVAVLCIPFLVVYVIMTGLAIAVALTAKTLTILGLV